MEPDTPRPMLDTERMRFSCVLDNKRKRAIKNAMPTLTPSVKAKIGYVVRKYRTKQRKLMCDEDIEDPNPYSYNYVFYCFQGVLEE
jgi:hypothetical protein